MEYSLECSTPCGIKDSFTADQLLLPVDVLRAQRLAASKIVSLARRCNQITLLTRAQRLAASKIVSHALIPSSKRHIERAQRLAASKIVSRDRVGSVLRIDIVVLNALRHQR